MTADIPLNDLFDRNELGLGWQVPGLRLELVTELIRGLPKDLRRQFIPAPDTARAVLATLGEPRGDLLDALSAELGRLGGVRIPRSAWDLAGLPAHLRVTYRVLDDGDAVLATGKDLDELRAELRPRLAAVLDEAAADLTRTGLTTLGLRQPAARVHAAARCAATRPSQTRAARSISGSSTPRRKRPSRCGSARAGCCCSRCHPACGQSPAACP